MLLGFILPALFTSSTCLSLPTTPTILQRPGQNTSSLTLKPWPSTPYVFSVYDSYPFPSYWIKINAYGAPGPSNTTLAAEILEELNNRIFLDIMPKTVIQNRNFSVPGLAARFMVPKEQGYGHGISPWQVWELLARLHQFTIDHGAVGIQGEKSLVKGGKVDERFELEWMFE